MAYTQSNRDCQERGLGETAEGGFLVWQGRSVGLREIRDTGHGRRQRENEAEAKIGKKCLRERAAGQSIDSRDAHGLRTPIEEDEKQRPWDKAGRDRDGAHRPEGDAART